MNLNIDPEFKAIIRPLSESEHTKLEKSLLKEGCRDSIIVWNDTIVDGHNRYEICTKNNKPFKTFEIKFSDKEEAIQWIIENQLARRNLTKEEIAYLIGKMYESEKKSMGGNRAQNTIDESQKIPDVQNGEVIEISEVKESTAEKIAARFKIGKSTVQRANDFSKAVDILTENVGGDVKTKILSGEVDMSKKDIIALAQTSPDNQIKTVKKSLNPEPEQPKEKLPREKTSKVNKILDMVDQLKNEEFLEFDERYLKMKERKNGEANIIEKTLCPEKPSIISQTQPEQRIVCQN